MKKRITFPTAKLIKFDIYDDKFEDLCDELASRWAQKAEQLHQQTRYKLSAR